MGIILRGKEAGASLASHVAIFPVKAYNNSGTQRTQRTAGREGGHVAYFNFQWTDEIVEHLAEHGVDP